MQRFVLVDDSSSRAAACCCCPDQNHHQQAGEKLALIYLQSGRPAQADQILQSLGFTCRLSQSILNYTYTTPALEAAAATATDNKDDVLPCAIFDNFLSHAEQTLLQSVFLDPAGSYWTDHNYTVEPPSPYFSYCLPLRRQRDGQERRFWRNRATGTPPARLFGCELSKPDLCPNLGQAEYVELWAHNRPHATGHQFHFDSDNEGCCSTDSGGRDSQSHLQLRALLDGRVIIDGNWWCGWTFRGHEPALGEPALGHQGVDVSGSPRTTARL